ncbi:MAG: DUF4139 domain-containing protein, partial [Syntrophales bacterium]|nr:DUF4139 domain-containing protein [Syntrophales bacterium]
MKTTLFFGRMPSFLILLLFLFPAGASAVPREVVIFPNSARVTDVVRISPQATGQGSLKALATLPAQAVPELLTTRLDPNVPLRIEDQSWRQINRQEEGKIAELQKKLQHLKMEKIAMLAAFQSLEAQLQFWQAQAKTKARTSDETVGLAALIGKNVKKDMQEKLTLEPDLERLDKIIRELQDEINRIAGQKDTLWEVTLILSGSPVRETNLTMTYTLKGCGWLSHYRLDARPRDGVIRFAWEAEIWQSSGIDWNQAETELATLQPLSAIAPPDLPPWIIRPRPGVLMTQDRQKAELRAASAAVAALSAEAQDESAPSETRRTTYAVWSLGKRTIPAGSRRRLNIREEVWPAEFIHLLRPSQTSQSFIRAAVNLPEGR